VALLVLLPHHMGLDAQVRLQEVTQLLHDHTLSSQRYSLIGPLFSAPFWLFGHYWMTTEWWAERYNWAVFSLGLLATYLLLRKRVDGRLLRAFFLILIAGSMFSYHLTTYYGEVFTAVCVGVGILAVTCRPALVGWIAIVLGVANTPATLAGLGLVVLKRAIDTKLLRSVLPLLGAACLIGLEAWVRRGNPLDQGYGVETSPQTVMPYSGLIGFSYPIFFGLLSLLFSFGKGILWFAPGLLLPVRKRLLGLVSPVKCELYSAYTLWIAFVAGLVLVYAPWWDWSGDWFWGPRFLLFASIPASFALALHVCRPSPLLLGKLAAVAALALSMWVGIDGAVFGQDPLVATCKANDYALSMLCQYTPEFSALWHPFVAWQTPNAQGLAFMGYVVVVFAYLAAPLVRELVVQTTALARGVAERHLRPSVWRV
jgi:hypothetical protein